MDGQISDARMHLLSVNNTSVVVHHTFFYRFWLAQRRKVASQIIHFPNESRASITFFEARQLPISHEIDTFFSSRISLSFEYANIHISNKKEKETSICVDFRRILFNAKKKRK